MMGKTETAYLYIKNKILDGTYKPTQKLTEIQLAEMIGASRNTVKNALLKLQQENLVTIEENKGATIKSFTLEEVSNYLEIREVLEGLVAKSAAINISDTALEELGNIFKEMVDHSTHNRFEEYSKMNQQFHKIIYSAAQNIQAVELITMIKTQLSRYQFRTTLVPGRNQASLKEHGKIYEALQRHDVSLTETAIKNHVAEVRRTIEQNYHYLM